MCQSPFQLIIKNKNKTINKSVVKTLSRNYKKKKKSRTILRTAIDVVPRNVALSLSETSADTWRLSDFFSSHASNDIQSRWLSGWVFGGTAFEALSPKFVTAVANETREDSLVCRRYMGKSKSAKALHSISVRQYHSLQRMLDKTYKLDIKTKFPVFWCGFKWRRTTATSQPRCCKLLHSVTLPRLHSADLRSTLSDGAHVTLWHLVAPWYLVALWRHAAWWRHLTLNSR